MKITKLAIFDDDDIRRELIQILIQATAGYECIGSYTDCRNLVRDFKKNLPDVVLMDIDMPNVNGIEGLKLIRQHFDGIKVIMQTVFEEESKILEAIIEGADGYILKKAHPVKLLDSIQDVLEGGSPMTPAVARQVLNYFNKNKPILLEKKEFNLSDRELEILSLLVQGFSYKMIADKCFITYATVNKHITHIYEKLHVQSGTEAVAKAIEHKIV